MKKLLLFVLIAFSISATAETFDIEVGGVGGSGVNPPYYAPQFLEIVTGDIVRWTWVGNNHNVTSTSGPESFSSGTHSSGFVFEFTFDVAGNYTFECTISNHSNTQFGGITVADSGVGVAEALPVTFKFYPNPATDFVILEKDNQLNCDIRVLDLTGKTVRTETNNALATVRIDVSDLPRGVYFIEVNRKGDVVRKKLMVK
ncbi:MAG: T9SS type A sorting domain-containing protein [Flavobacteriales bacterium]|nr:T9SS type A sorting domain-containing protein [Flavobacteriales bacterium]